MIMAMVLPATIELMSGSEAQGFYIQGFQVSALAVVAIMLTGTVINSFHKALPARGAGGGSPQTGAAAADD